MNLTMPTEFSGYAADILKQPLVAEPGTAWQYGVNVDWAGTVVERVSGLKLNDYFKKNIFEPLGITDISMFPTTDMMRRLASMHHRDSDGKLRTRDHLLRRPLIADESEQPNIYNSAGAGCYAKPTEYCKILATLLNDGTSPTTGKAILKKESVDKMLENSIPHMPDFARNGIPNAKPDQTNSIPEMYPQANNPPQGWNCAGFLNIEKCPTGRSANSTWWAGLANLFWFLDREKGVAGIVATQILPFGDAQAMGLWAGIEIGLYKALD
jgi:CubicO group peptidase (beta-lactamase class C family)